ncbi:MAG: DinB family protein [Cyclobacteriaceae bacterium]
MQLTETQRIADMLRNTFDGAAWHGPSVMQVLRAINVTVAFRHTEGIHTIAELVYHMTTWRNFTIKRLLGQHAYDVSEVDNFPIFDSKDEQTWKKVLLSLEDSQELLLQTLEKTPVEKLNEKVGDKPYDFYTLLHGMIQHDIYHLGQIILLSKMK